MKVTWLNVTFRALRMKTEDGKGHLIFEVWRAKHGCQSWNPLAVDLWRMERIYSMGTIRTMFNKLLPWKQRGMCKLCRCNCFYPIISRSHNKYFVIWGSMINCADMKFIIPVHMELFHNPSVYSLTVAWSGPTPDYRGPEERCLWRPSNSLHNYTKL